MPVTSGASITAAPGPESPMATDPAAAGSGGYPVSGTSTAAGNGGAASRRAVATAPPLSLPAPRPQPQRDRHRLALVTHPAKEPVPQAPVAPLERAAVVVGPAEWTSVRAALRNGVRAYLFTNITTTAAPAIATSIAAVIAACGDGAGHGSGDPENDPS